MLDPLPACDWDASAGLVILRFDSPRPADLAAAFFAETDPDTSAPRVAAMLRDIGASERALAFKAPQADRFRLGLFWIDAAEATPGAALARAEEAWRKGLGPLVGAWAEFRFDASLRLDPALNAPISGAAEQSIRLTAFVADSDAGLRTETSHAEAATPLAHVARLCDATPAPVAISARIETRESSGPVVFGPTIRAHPPLDYPIPLWFGWAEDRWRDSPDASAAVFGAGFETSRAPMVEIDVTAYRALGDRLLDAFVFAHAPLGPEGYAQPAPPVRAGALIVEAAEHEACEPGVDVSRRTLIQHVWTNAAHRDAIAVAYRGTPPLTVSGPLAAASGPAVLEARDADEGGGRLVSALYLGETLRPAATDADPSQLRDDLDRAFQAALGWAISAAPGAEAALDWARPLCASDGASFAGADAATPEAVTAYAALMKEMETPRARQAGAWELAAALGVGQLSFADFAAQGDAMSALLRILIETPSADWIDRFPRRLAAADAGAFDTKDIAVDWKGDRIETAATEPDIPAATTQTAANRAPDPMGAVLAERLIAALFDLDAARWWRAAPLARQAAAFRLLAGGVDLERLRRSALAFEDDGAELLRSDPAVAARVFDAAIDVEDRWVAAALLAQAAPKEPSSAFAKAQAAVLEAVGKVGRSAPDSAKPIAPNSADAPDARDALSEDASDLEATREDAPPQPGAAPDREPDQETTADPWAAPVTIEDALAAADRIDAARARLMADIEALAGACARLGAPPPASADALWRRAGRTFDGVKAHQAAAQKLDDVALQTLIDAATEIDAAEMIEIAQRLKTPPARVEAAAKLRALARRSGPLASAYLAIEAAFAGATSTDGRPLDGPQEPSVARRVLAARPRLMKEVETLARLAAGAAKTAPPKWRSPRAERRQLAHVKHALLCCDAGVRALREEIVGAVPPTADENALLDRAKKDLETMRTHADWVAARRVWRETVALIRRAAEDAGAAKEDAQRLSLRLSEPVANWPDIAEEMERVIERRGSTPTTSPPERPRAADATSRPLAS